MCANSYLHAYILSILHRLLAALVVAFSRLEVLGGTFSMAEGRLGSQFVDEIQNNRGQQTSMAVAAFAQQVHRLVSSSSTPPLETLFDSLSRHSWGVVSHIKNPLPVLY